VYEGGIRVPGMVRWPGKTRPGTTTDVPVIGSDIFVTAVGIAGAKLPTDRVLDGGNLLAAIDGRAVDRARPLYWRCVIAPGPLKTAMRIGDWKILADEPLTQFELYDLKSDPQEKTDLSTTNAAKLVEMTVALVKLNTEIEAEGPDWWKSDNRAQKKPRNNKKYTD
ncbi:MAG TPA: sulfatase/phosphatase domain-containing protein, partial [Caulifigura sp.]|nr:sulfatase/phosphatase domain-containing protein [Caulifigura sp.]